MVDPVIEFDDAEWKKMTETFRVFVKRLLDHDNLRSIGGLILKHYRGLPDELCDPQKGSFNVCLQMKFRNGRHALIRIASPGKSMFPDEKVKREVSVMRYLAFHTNVPVPHVLHYGRKEECPAELGAFIIMEYVANDGDLCDALNTPGRSLEERPILNPQIPEEKLQFVYGQMANILLQISKHNFEGIGCVAEADEDDEFNDTWVVKHRPLTYNMNELVQLGCVPPHVLPQSTFQTSTDFYSALADLHRTHLSFQRNDIVESADDCRRKYVGRLLFRKLAQKGRFCGKSDRGPFKLFCDDFRPANVLANSEHFIVGAVDWEFTYTAPEGFCKSPPLWLLLERPEYWPEGLDDWTKNYETSLKTFLEALQSKEREALDSGLLGKEQLLSESMKESWESGDFWVNYAARNSWAFDMIYWSKIDRRFYGDGGFDDRLQLLSHEEKEEMENLVLRKISSLEVEKGDRNP